MSESSESKLSELRELAREYGRLEWHARRRARELAGVSRTFYGDPRECRAVARLRELARRYRSARHAIGVAIDSELREPPALPPRGADARC